MYMRVTRRTLIFAIACIILLLPILTDFRNAENQDNLTLSQYYLIFSICAGLLILAELLLAQRHEKRELKKRLRSRDNTTVSKTLEVLRSSGWLTDGSLKTALLHDANLQGSKLAGADLQGVNFHNANLKGCNLAAANLRKAYLSNANLQGVDLTDANLQEVILERIFIDIFTPIQIMFNEETTLPDGNQWTPETDMTRFTDPNHPNFWRSDDPDSPAYGG